MPCTTVSKESAREVFDQLPKITPATYNGNPTYKQYSYEIPIPLEPTEKAATELVDVKSNTKIKGTRELTALESKIKSEYDSISKEIVPYENKTYKSQLNVPFTHQYYAKFDRNMNLVGSNMHTAAKPFIYADVANYYDFEAQKEALKKGSDAWWQRKLFNEHLVSIQGKDYWFTLDPIFDLQVGKDSEADFNSTFNNTRGIFLQGGLGDKLSFSTSIYESQGRFPQYFNQYAEIT